MEMAHFRRQIKAYFVYLGGDLKTGKYLMFYLSSYNTEATLTYKCKKHG